MKIYLLLLLMGSLLVAIRFTTAQDRSSNSVTQ